jgi:cytochrome b561
MAFWRSDDRQYSGFAKLLHWGSALIVIGLFILGLWMTSLNYYHSWYRTAPDIHKSVGIALVLVTFIRLIYRFATRYPAPLPSHSLAVRLAAKAVHIAIYGLLLVMFVSGYLITTARGEPLVVFGGLVEIPGIISGFANLEDRAGEVHEIAAYTLVGLAVLHAAAALKHHFIDKDDTLRRMIRVRSKK